MSAIPRESDAPKTGIVFAMLAAVLFGISTPLAKLLLGSLPPLMLAGLLYLGSGVGLSVLRAVRPRHNETPLSRRDAPWLAGAVLFGGVLGPALLMLGLSATPGSTSALLLNFEGVFTALLAWFAFRENFDRRVALGMLAIVAGGVVLSWQGGGFRLPLGSLAIVGACLCWGIDNNLTQKVSASDPFQTAAIKGAVAGAVNLSIALLTGARLPSVASVAGAMGVGFLGYGLSLALFVLALRHIGTARTGAYFSLAPFVGALVAVPLLREPIGVPFLAAAILMGLGVWLHLTERHEHWHEHRGIPAGEPHTHDKDHQREHTEPVEPGKVHSHPWPHAPFSHTHPHYPDLEHRHHH